MIRTISDRFPNETGNVFARLNWGGREEMPGEVARRLFEMRAAIELAFASAELVWDLGPAGDGYFDGPVPFPESLEGLVAEVVRRDSKLDDGIEQWKEAGYAIGGGGTLVTELESTRAVSVGVRAGAFETMDNSVSLNFKGTAPLGSKELLVKLFSDIVRIWQPDYGTFITSDTNRSRRGYYDAAQPGYVCWVSSLAFKTPEPTPFATATSFGDGTLLVMNDWSVESYGEFYDALEAQGVLTTMPQTQVVPSLPNS